MICSYEAELYIEKDGFLYFQCSLCKLLFLDPIPTADVLSKFYSKDYFEMSANDPVAYHCGYDNYEEAGMFKESFYKLLLDRIKKYRVHKILDVGAAYGGFVTFLNRHGLDAMGIEISEFATAKAQQAGINVTHASLESLSQNNIYHNVFDMICLSDVFEHLYDYSLALEAINTLLVSDGYLLIVTPSSGGVPARLLGKRWYHFLPPQHIHLFNEKNIAMFLELHHFKIIETQYIAKQFSIKYFFHIFEGWLHVSLPTFLKHRFGNNVFTFPLKDNILVIAKKYE